MAQTVVAYNGYEYRFSLVYINFNGPAFSIERRAKGKRKFENWNLDYEYLNGKCIRDFKFGSQERENSYIKFLEQLFHTGEEGGIDVNQIFQTLLDEKIKEEIKRFKAYKPADFHYRY